MGIIVSKENFTLLTTEFSALASKKLGEAIVRHLCRAFSVDERWVVLNKRMAEKLALKGVDVPRGDFAKTKFIKGFILEREKGILRQHFHSEDKVIAGWHNDAISGLIKEGFELTQDQTKAMFEIGQKVIESQKPNLPYTQKKLDSKK